MAKHALLKSGAEVAYWDADTVRAALAEAGRTLRAWRCRGCWPAEYRSTAPEPVRLWWEAYGQEPPELRLPVPSPAAIGRFDRVLGWIAGAADVATRRVLWEIVHGVSLRRAARAQGCSHEAVRRRRARAVAELTASLNRL
ncbi:MAG: hypothetical protein GC191_08030 [Azospirillum sp.]|nr:hypothetical protein [Azospirillum sp.]